MSRTGKYALIVVDMSVEQVSDVSHSRQEVIDNIRRLILGPSTSSEVASSSPEDPPRGFDLVVDSRLWLTDPSQSSLAWVWEGTAKTLFVADSPGASLIPELSDLASQMTFVPKYNYSCFAGEQCQLGPLLRSHNISRVAIAGINTDYCVFATALDAFQRHLHTAVVADAVTSVRGQSAHDEGLRNIERHLGPPAILTTDDVLLRLGSTDSGDDAW